MEEKAIIRIINSRITYIVSFFGLFLFSFSLYLARSIRAAIHIDKEINGVLRESVIIVLEMVEGFNSWDGIKVIEKNDRRRREAVVIAQEFDRKTKDMVSMIIGVIIFNIFGMIEGLVCQIRRIVLL